MNFLDKSKTAIPTFLTVSKTNTDELGEQLKAAIGSAVTDIATGQQPASVSQQHIALIKGSIATLETDEANILAELAEHEKNYLAIKASLESELSETRLTLSIYRTGLSVVPTVASIVPPGVPSVASAPAPAVNIPDAPSASTAPLQAGASGSAGTASGTAGTASGGSGNS